MRENNHGLHVSYAKYFYANIPKYMFIVFICSNLYRNYKFIKVLLRKRKQN